jgi:dolichol-phosphate mannosyltransferase
MSKMMNKSARIILGVSITDYTNGYRCYNRRVVEYLVKQAFTSKGFVVLSEIVYRSHKKGFTFAEIPFDFKQVSTGSSNLNMKEVIEAILTLFRLRFIK